MRTFDPDAIKLEFKYYHVIAILFITCFIVSNILSIKVFAIDHIMLPAGIITFPISYVFSDILTEVYGFQRARQLVWLAITCNLLLIGFAYIAIALPVAPGWGHQQAALKEVFGIEPRMVLASSVAYFVGDLINCGILAKLKLIHQNRFMWLRFISSTAIGAIFDTLLFCVIAFSLILPFKTLLWLALCQYIFKFVYECIMMPFSVRVSEWLKHQEQTDIYDFGTTFSPLHFNINYKRDNNRYSKQ